MRSPEPGLGPQVLGVPLGVVGDDRVGRVEDRLRAAVVLVEHHRGDPAEPVVERLLELDDVAEVGAPKAVHRLVRVADDGDVAVAAGEQQHDRVLRLVRVLVLVDEDVLEAAAVLLEHVGVLAEQAHGVHEQVVEVHRPGGDEALLVLGEHLGVLALEDVLSGGGRVRRVDELVLPRRDLGVHPPRREALRVEPEVADHVAGEAGGVGLVVDRELPRVAELVGVGAQDAHARRVERRHPHRPAPPARPARPTRWRISSAALLVNVMARIAPAAHALVDQVGDAVGEHPGLAGAGAGDHEQRSALVDDGVELVRVEPRERCS